MPALKCWHIFIGIRWLWVLFPQNGYIHPDEYFQTVEVISGDVLEIDIYKSWEFHPASTLRSMFLPCILFRPSFLLLDVVAFWSKWFGGPQIVTPYTVLLVPRLVMLALSLPVDMLVYKQTRLNRKLDVDLVMFLYTSSYIALVHYTRALTNSLEAFLFIGLLYCIQKDMVRLERIFRQYPRSRLTRTTRHERPSPLGPVSWYDPGSLIFLSSCIIFGFFNRPTFLFFGFWPVLHWLLDGTYPRSLAEWKQALPYVLYGAKVIGKYATPLTILVLGWDSLYYSNSDGKGFYQFSYDAHSPDLPRHVTSPVSGILQFITVTPYNFIKYNLQVNNLAKHGVHPHWTHFAVNQLLLFGPLILYLYKDMLRVVCGKRTFLTRLRSKALDNVHFKPYIYSYIFSLTFFSVFPHQEARFLIPLLFLVVILYAYFKGNNKPSRTFKSMWLVFNLLGCVFYGELHQGAVFKSASYVHNLTKSLPRKAVLNVIYSHTYMPPKHWFLINKPAEKDLHSMSVPASTMVQKTDMEDIFEEMQLFYQNLQFNITQTYVPYSQLKLHDLMGKPMEEIRILIDKLTAWSNIIDDRIYVIAPATMDQELCSMTGKYQFMFVRSFKFHLSMEDPPPLSVHLLTQNKTSSCPCLHSCVPTKGLQFYLSLNLYILKNMEGPCPYDKANMCCFPSVNKY